MVLVLGFLIMASHIAFRISCPLQGYDGRSGGNGKGLSKKYVIDHLGTHHFKTNVLKASHKARIASDFSLFSAFDQALHQAGIWLCCECFCTHTFSKNCKHAANNAVLIPSFDDVAIYGILVPLRPVVKEVEAVVVESAGTPATDDFLLSPLILTSTFLVMFSQGTCVRLNVFPLI